MKKRVNRKPKKEKPIIGWREWVSLPQLGIEKVKPKIDTGARSSAIHAFEVKEFTQDETRFVRFKIHPLQRNSKITVEAVAPLLEYRTVKSSGGHQTRRPVIVTEITWGQHSWEIELTLSSRDTMGFRMLLGREAVRGRFLVDPGQSFLGGKFRPQK